MYTRTLINGMPIFCDANQEVTDILANAINNSIMYENNQKFVPGEKFQINGSVDELTREIEKYGVYTHNDAKKEALALVYDKYGEVLGCVEDGHGRPIYNIETATVPIISLPERFLKKI